MRTSKLLALSFLAGLLLFTAGCQKLQSRDEMNRGVKAYKNNHYPDAIKHFKEAIRLDPANDNAQSYLAVSYFISWVPGVDSVENKRSYDAARQEFNEILKKDPSNSLALTSMAAMAYNSASSGTPEQKAAALAEARKWNERRIEVNPKESEAYYYLGIIDWAQAFPPIRDARAEAKMKADDPGPLKDAKVREELKGKLWDQINHGIDSLTKCLDIDKENEDAMSYMNLLLREKAVLEDTPDAAKADVAKAEEWSNRSLDMKKIKAARPAKKTAS